MDRNPELPLEFLPITLEQQKLLASAIRIKILHVISDVPRTVKQVADILHESPGNIHYHMQRLQKGKLVELVDTREVNGILEKYYKSVHTRFRIHPGGAENRVCTLRTYLRLNKEQIKQLEMELIQLLEKWERLTPGDQTEPSEEIAVDVSIVKTDSEENEGSG